MIRMCIGKMPPKSVYLQKQFPNLGWGIVLLFFQETCRKSPESAFAAIDHLKQRT